MWPPTRTLSNPLVTATHMQSQKHCSNPQEHTLHNAKLITTHQKQEDAAGDGHDGARGGGAHAVQPGAHSEVGLVQAACLCVLHVVFLVCCVRVRD